MDFPAHRPSPSLLVSFHVHVYTYTLLPKVNIQKFSRNYKLHELGKTFLARPIYCAFKHSSILHESFLCENVATYAVAVAAAFFHSSSVILRIFISLHSTVFTFACRVGQCSWCSCIVALNSVHRFFFISLTLYQSSPLSIHTNVQPKLFRVTKHFSFDFTLCLQQFLHRVRTQYCANEKIFTVTNGPHWLLVYDLQNECKRIFLRRSFCFASISNDLLQKRRRDTKKTCESIQTYTGSIYN